jgi:2-polyprenyl-3-methyl-5-hydroxy-6-metoxy-1,4-benzoquinol methylase
MRLERVAESVVPGDLAAWYARVYAHVGPGRYQQLAYHAGHERERLDRTLEVIEGIEPRRSCLEVGCSEGFITERIAPLFERVVAMDISEQALSVCPALPNVEYRRGDIEKCEIPGDFDVVLLSDVLEHLRDPKGVIARCADHCRYLVVAGPTTEPLNESNAFAFTMIAQPQRPGDGTGHIWYMDKAGLLSLFGGLRVEKEMAGGTHHTVALVRGRLP